MSLFSNLGQSTSASQPNNKSLFGAVPQAQTGSSLFGAPQQQQTSSGFGSSQPQQAGGLFKQSAQQFSQSGQTSSLFGGNLGQNTQQLQPQQNQPGPTSSLFGGNFGQSTQQPQQQQQPQPQQQQSQLTFGQSGNQDPLQSQIVKPLWEEGRGLGSIYRTIPAQINILKERWNPQSLSSPLRTYLYQKVDKENAPFFQPGPGEDEEKWEQAILKRPGPEYVPALARGFWDLGKRAQRQREFIEYCNIRLHEINASLDAQLEFHNQKVASRLSESRRKHVVASQRVLALAAKIQILRSRGYAMDQAEDELKLKLEEVERQIFEPTVNGREQEIWARMIEIQARSKQLQLDIERTTPMAEGEDDGLDEATIKAARNALQAYDTQLRHLQKELKTIQDEYAEWENPGGNVERIGR